MSRVRRWLARICGERTMSRVVDPVLSDIEVERRPRWRGYLTLARALALHGVLSAGTWPARAMREDGGALTKVAASFLVTSLALTMLLEIPMWSNRSAAVIVLLAPQALALAMPAALLLAIPFALARSPLSPRLVRRIAALAVLLVPFTFANIRLVPAANQRYREVTAGQPLEKGPNELALSELRQRTEVLNLTPGGRRAARGLEYLYQVRVALALAPLPIGLAALLLARSARTRRRAVAAGAATIVAYVGALFAVAELQGTLLSGTLAAAPLLLAWLPNGMLAGSAVLIYLIAIATPPNPWTTLPPPGSSNDRIS
jgi:hypothetical protein